MLTPAYAILVGANLPGPGQQPLRYAVADAQRVADVLVELADYAPERVHLLADPSVAELTSAFAAVGEAIDARDERATVTFYYSGHARARALDLGGEQLPIDDLRARLDELGATLTFVVLDACQAGATGTAKGVEVVPDFSSQSIAGLRSEGLVVLASSTGDELRRRRPDVRGGRGLPARELRRRRGLGRDLPVSGAAALYHRYGPALRRKCERMAIPTEDAEDIVQQVFTDLTRRGFRAVTSRGLNLLRDQRRREGILARHADALTPASWATEAQVFSRDVILRLAAELPCCARARAVTPSRPRGVVRAGG